MEGFAPFCLVYCFVVIQLYHKMERISSFFALFFVVWLVLDLWITLEVQYTETQENIDIYNLISMDYNERKCILLYFENGLVNGNGAEHNE